MWLVELARTLKIIVRYLDTVLVKNYNIMPPAKFYVRTVDGEAILLQSVGNPKRYLCIADDLLSGQVSRCSLSVAPKLLVALAETCTLYTSSHTTV